MRACLSCKSDLLFVPKLQQTPVTTPKMIDAHGGMNPDAGVAATNPEMTPEHQPTMDHFFASRKSSRHHAMEAKMAVKQEFQQAIVARKLAPNEEPPLKPNQPNHRKTVPSVTRETLWGRKLSIIFSCLRPSTHE